MPGFIGGSVHVATVSFSNPKSTGFDYQAVLCMGAAWTEMATTSFHLDAGQSKPILFSVTMPTTTGTYPVYFKVTSGGVLIGTFTATDPVIVALALAFTFSAPQGTMRAPTGIGYGWRLAEISCVVTNPGSVAVTRQIRVLYGSVGSWNSDRIWVYLGSVWKEVTLGPGQSTTLKQPHEFIIPGVDPYLYGSYWNGPGFGIPSSWSFKLVDDLGNESPVITLTRNA